MLSKCLEKALKVKHVTVLLDFYLQDGANIVKKMKGVFCFRVKNKDGKEGIWIVDAKNGTGSVTFGGPGNAHFINVIPK